MDGPFNTHSPVQTDLRGIRLFRRMRFLTCLTFLACSFLTKGANADEPFAAFIEGLRQRQYFDTAMEYIDALQQRADLPVDVKDLLDLERGVTLQQKGAASRVPEDREQALGEAETALRKFIAEKAEHPQAALANSMLGELLFERARSLIWKSDEVESADEKLQLQQSARTLIDQAKGIYQTAQDKYKILFDAFPKFIDPAKDEEEFERRLEAEAKYLRAWFNLVRCTYERGQTFEKGSEERKTTLIQASELFEQIHTKYRTNQIGLHARLMMGKCFQEQDDLGRALGIYNEMLGHKSESPAVELLKAIALHYRLICLNDPQKNDHQLVIQESTEWMRTHRSMSTTQMGLGILWEKAIAEEKYGANRELPETEKLNILRAALNDATQVAKYAGPYKEPANAMTRRLKAELGDKDKEPKDFATAFERARGMIAQIQQFSDEVNKAPDAATKAQKKNILDNHLLEVGRLLQLALDLRDSDSDPRAVAQSRYLLSFVMLRQGKALDSVILSRYCMVQDRSADPDTALNASEIAMAAAVAVWNQASGRDRDFETRVMRDVCEKILELYPQSARGGEARMRLGTVYRTMNQPIEGAKWFLQVPESDPQYTSARISAGQSYWAAWTQKSALAAADPEGQQIDPEEMKTWKTEARNLLTQGIQLTREKLGDMAIPTEELVAAEVSLASIMNLDGEFATTIERLTAGGENSVVAVIDVENPDDRPGEGIKSRTFAGLTYRLLLRAYVGTQQTDQALQTMTKLEKVGGEDILSAYTQLGIELQEELKRLQQTGEAERLTQVRDSFEKFLNKVYESRNKSDYNSLLWIGETYYGLGQGVSGDAVSAENYYSKAADAYAEIISGGLANADNRNAVQLRLARCRRQQKQFAEALQLVQEILAANAMTLDAQFEAAHILSDWGANGEPPRLMEAIAGVKDASVWGWSQLARRLQQLVAKDPNPEYRERFIDARYEMSNSRRRFANADGVADKDRDSHRKSALAEITSFVQVFRDLDDVSFARLDRLYQDVQADLGQAPKPLERSAPMEPELPVVPAVAEAPQDQGTKAAVAVAAPTTAASEAGVSSILLPILGVSLCIGLGVGFVIFLRKPQKRVHIPTPSSAPSLGALSFGAETAAGIGESIESASSSMPDFSGLGAVGVAGRRTAAVAKASRPARPEGAVRQRPAGASDKISPAEKPAAARRPTASGGDAPAAPSKAQTRSAPPATGGSGTPRPAGAEGIPASRPVPKRPPGQRPATGSSENVATPGKPPRPPSPEE